MKTHSILQRLWNLGRRPALLLALAVLILAGCSGETTAPANGEENDDPADLVGTYVIVDTGQSDSFDTAAVIAEPASGEAFSGQDARYVGAQPSYVVSGDGLTVYDENTGLTWQRSPDTDADGDIDAADKKTYEQCLDYPDELNAAVFGGYADWRLPTIKEQYSLILFSGLDPSGYEGDDPSGLVPFLDTDAFAFAYGDLDAGERIIDSQYASSTLYVDGGQLLFGVNFADGRIKGYGMTMPGGRSKTFLVTCVRGNTDYGVNDFDDNGDGTVTDHATALMWTQADAGSVMNWEDALAWAESLELAGHADWRLPNVKELQSLVDYERSPGTTGTAAIDPLFDCTAFTNEQGVQDYCYYWSSTTHENMMTGGSAAYVCFGRGLGFMDGAWVDVHGAGSQRSDPKDGDPSAYPEGHGPQGDAIRILNAVRAVRDAP